MLTSLLTVSLATGGGLYDSYAGLSFRNPADNNIVYPGDGISHKEQCVLYSVSNTVPSPPPSSSSQCTIRESVAHNIFCPLPTTFHF